MGRSKPPSTSSEPPPPDPDLDILTTQLQSLSSRQDGFQTDLNAIQTLIRQQSLTQQSLIDELRRSRALSSLPPPTSTAPPPSPHISTPLGPLGVLSLSPSPSDQPPLQGPLSSPDPPTLNPHLTTTPTAPTPENPITTPHSAPLMGSIPFSQFFIPFGTAPPWMPPAVSQNHPIPSPPIVGTQQHHTPTATENPPASAPHATPTLGTPPPLGFPFGSQHPWLPPGYTYSVGLPCTPHGPTSIFSPSGHEPGSHSFGPRGMKIELPRFFDDDPIGWIAMAEEFLEYYQVDEGRRVAVAATHLSGDAALWLKWFKARHPTPTWQMD